MISGGPIDDDSNQAQKRHNYTECMVVRTPEVESDLMLEFIPGDLEGAMPPHNDALIIHATLANYNMTKVFADVNNSFNVLFRATLE